MPGEEMKPPDLRGDSLALLGFLAMLIYAVGSVHGALWKIPGTAGRNYFGLASLFAAVFGYPLYRELAGDGMAGATALEYRLWTGWVWLLVFQALLAKLIFRPRPSQYIGSSWFWFARTTRGKALCETAAGLALGATLTLWTASFGRYVVLVTLIGALHVALIAWREVRVAQQLYDNEFEAGRMRERYRDWRG